MYGKFSTLKMQKICNFKQIGYYKSKSVIRRNAFLIKADFGLVFVLLLAIHW
jgi:hypothetical protein